MASPSILFFSRGRGFGHAITDLEIERELADLNLNCDLLYCSYGAGAGVFRSQGKNVRDMQLPDESSPLAVLLKASVEIERHGPQIIVSHEEPFVPVAAKMRGIPCIYMSTWLPPLGSLAWEAIENADSILVIEDEGLFPFPRSVAHKIRYSGPVVRKMRYTSTDREALRADLGCEREAVVWLAIQGGWATEGRAPIAQTLLSAFRKLGKTHSRTNLFWLGEVKEPPIRSEFDQTPNVKIVPFCDNVEKYLLASDVVFTKGTHGVTLEAAQAGIPSISISYKGNPIDEILIPRVSNNTHYHALAVTPETLLQEAERLRKGRAGFLPRDYSVGRAKAAGILHEEIVRLMG